MTRYHFHSVDGTAFRDVDGEELRDLNEAKAVAIDVLAAALPAKQAQLWESRSFAVFVKDDAGRVVASLTTTAMSDPDPDPASAPNVRGHAS